MNNEDIRWKQRFENFSKAFSQLDEAIYPVIASLPMQANGRQAKRSGAKQSVKLIAHYEIWRLHIHTN